VVSAHLNSATRSMNFQPSGVRWCGRRTARLHSCSSESQVASFGPFIGLVAGAPLAALDWRAVF
jgi:hypothetical protein